jgi:2,3-dihydroxybenzoate decarboxylase
MSMRRRSLLQAPVLAAAGSAAAQAPAAKPKRIAVEEGFQIPEVMAEARRLARAPAGPVAPARADLNRALLDLGPGRIAAMDEDGIAKQLLLLSAPGVQAFEEGPATELASLANARLAEAVGKYPDRFAALTVIAPQNPGRAAQELERGVRTLGFKGALINSHTRGEYLDDRKFWPILEAAQAIDAPIYLHPRDPVPGMAGPLTIPGFNIGWGYGVETGTHLLRMIAAGVFDEFPRLRIVVGHLGEGLAFFLQRLDNRFEWENAVNGRRSSLRRMPGDYIRENIWVSTSGMNTWPQIRMCIEVLGIDRVLFAVDHPFEVGRDAVQAVDRAPMSEADRAALYHRNAERVFRL